MPLVVPGLQSKEGSGEQDWMSKLMGKKLGQQHDEMVSLVPLPSLSQLLLGVREVKLMFCCVRLSRSRICPRSTAFSSPIA